MTRARTGCIDQLIARDAPRPSYLVDQIVREVAPTSGVVTIAIVAAVIGAIVGFCAWTVVHRDDSTTAHMFPFLGRWLFGAAALAAAAVVIAARSRRAKLVALVRDGVIAPSRRADTAGGMAFYTVVGPRTLGVSRLHRNRVLFAGGERARMLVHPDLALAAAISVGHDRITACRVGPIARPQPA